MTEHIRDDEIRQRAIVSSKTALTRHYLAKEEGDEVDFLAADIDPDDEYFVIYEIFVPSHLRHHGIGTRLLRRTEELGKGLEFQQVLLRAKSLDPSYPQDDIVRSYRKNGYSTSPDSGGALVKTLND